MQHWGRFEHDESSRFEIIGYPSSWGSRGKGRGQGRVSRGGQTGGSRGRGGGREAAYSAGSIFGPNGFGQQEQELIHEEKCNGTFSGFTSDKVQKLLSLVKPSQLDYEKLAGKSYWIIESGASHHMTSGFVKS